MRVYNNRTRGLNYVIVNFLNDFTKIRFIRNYFFNLCFKVFLISYRSNRTRIKNFFIFNKTTYYFYLYQSFILKETIFLRKIQNSSVISRDIENPHFFCQNKSLIAIKKMSPKQKRYNYDKFFLEHFLKNK